MLGLFKEMAEGIAPFVSSSPPPLDDDNFKFGDEDDLFAGGSLGDALNEIYVQEFEQVKKHLPTFEIELKKTSDLSNNIVGCVDEFDEFLDYQSITVNDINANMVTAPGDSIKSQTCDASNLTNQLEIQTVDEIHFKCDEFDNFEEFVSNENVETDIRSTENEVVSLADIESLKVNYDSKEIESEVSNSSDSGEKVSTQAHIYHQNSNVSNQQQDKILNEESWACFESCGDSLTEEFFPPITSSCLPNDVIDDDDDDFGGFEEATESISDVIHIGCGTEIFKELFSARPCVGSGFVSPLVNLIGAQKDGRPGTYEEHTKYSRIWKKLESIETTPALSMHWKNSSLFQNYLKTINIIQQNLVSSRSSNAPLFASTLGILEPTKLYGDGVSDSKDCGNTSVNDIPKVEFDWANSVLMDPLDACKKEKELLESLEPSLSDPQKSLSLDSFMASVASNNVTLIKNHAGLSVTPHLKVILDRLPDLSFMQAKVLMFPVREEFIGTTETFS